MKDKNFFPNYPAKLGTVINKMRGANHDRPIMMAGPTPNNDMRPVTKGSPKIHIESEVLITC